MRGRWPGRGCARGPVPWASAVAALLTPSGQAASTYGVDSSHCAHPSSFPDDRSELEGSTLSVLSATASTSRLLPPQERLRDKAFEYCQRLIEQSNRRECPGRRPPPAVSCLGLLLFPKGLWVFRHNPQGAQH